MKLININLIKKELSAIIHVWGRVFGNWRYILLAIFIAVVFYIIEALLTNLRFILQRETTLGFPGILAVLPGFVEIYPAFISHSSFVSTIIISILLGMLFSLVVYKTRALRSFSGKTGVFTTIGIFFGILAPGCSACGLGLLPAIGLGSAALTFLPFGGLSIFILSMIILVILIYNLSKNINRGIVCQVIQVK